MVDHLVWDQGYAGSIPVTPTNFRSGYNKELMMSTKNPKKHNAPWTPADLKKMRQLARAKLSARLAARELGRSTGSVKYKAMTEGIRFRFIEQPPGVQRKLARARRRRR